MNNRILIRIALRALRNHKGRSLLTMLGIIIGIAAIISSLSIGYGTEEKIRKKILALGNNNIEIWAGRTASTDLPVTKLPPPKKLVLNDVAYLARYCPEIIMISPFLHMRYHVYHQGVSAMTHLKGGNETLTAILGRSLERGHMFNHHHLEHSSRVAVLGAKVAELFFKTNSPLHQTIMVNNQPITIIGVLKPIIHYSGNQDPNLDIFMPYSTLKNHIIRLCSNQIYGILASTQTPEKLPALVNRVEKLLRAKHNLDEQVPNDFCISDQQSLLKTAQATSTTLNVFLFIIASLSLLVGGIGVMNIMLVSVSERTNEIGTLMSIGAKPSDIRRQFLIETMCICAIGGIIGILIGCFTPFIAYYVTGLPVVLKLRAILIASTTILLVGLSFGMYPAIKASKLNPVDALTQNN